MDGSHKSRSLVGKYSAFAPGVRPYTKKYKPRKAKPKNLSRQEACGVVTF
jgi:hypothetical protein